MNIIYVSNLISKNKMHQIIQKSNKKPLQSIQKFHRLLCMGFAKNGIKVTALSAIPMSRQIDKKTIWIDKKEKEDGVEYKYVPFLNLKVLRQICIMIGTIFLIVREILKERKQEKIFICDILDTTVSFMTLILSKIFRVTCVGIVTDLPENMTKTNKLSKFLENNCDLYILITEQMNDKINKKNRPYIVVEGLVDKRMELQKNSNNSKYNNKVCVYAGGLYEKYGVKALIEAFRKISINNAELHLYGTGDLENYINDLKDEKIKYYGVIENDEIVKEEIKSTLLINPRFTKEEYTKYSFPSKNMEYMVSGTPVLTTNLPGMPKEYLQYVYLFDEETEECYMNKLEEILKKDSSELCKKGELAKKFVLENKNNIIQSKKIIDFIKEKGN